MYCLRCGNQEYMCCCKEGLPHPQQIRAFTCPECGEIFITTYIKVDPERCPKCWDRVFKNRVERIKLKKGIK